MPSSKPTPGVNDLASQFPEVAKEALGWDPSLVRYGSKKNLEWQCSEGHTWIAKPNSRTGNEKIRGCPYCTNRKVWKGFNDLESLFPEVAQEADGWDPAEFTWATAAEKEWKCSLGHTWKMKVCHRTGPNTKQGCPYCANQKVWPGFNDLKSNFEDIAKEAYGWDPSTITKKSSKKMNWKCPIGHIYDMRVCLRTDQGQNCPYCSNNRLLKGYNDLATTHPDIALQADGWLGDSLVAGSNKRKSWICDLGHRWKTSPQERTGGGTGCPTCANLVILPGFNDLKTAYPLIAQQADGWDPSKYAPRTDKRKKWKCSEGHSWFATIAGRTGGANRKGRDCPYCANSKLLVGFNDLLTKFPEVAKEADGWNPEQYLYGSAQEMPWKCSKGHTWRTKIANRTNQRDHTGCPTCATSGFSPGKPAWFYLLARPGEQQLGITNDFPQRMRAHSINGWIEIEKTGPHDGSIVLALERELKKWLRKDVGLVPGTSENWFTVNMEVKSLRDLKENSGIATDLF